jgi:hypothetical protein
MATGDSDERLGELITEAYRDVHLRTPLAAIERSARRRPARRIALAAATAVAAGAVLIGGWLLLPGGGAVTPAPAPGDSAAASAGNPGGKPPRPTSSASTPAGICADFARPELAAAPGLTPADRDALPPLRFDRTLVDGSLSLLLFASERVEVACWVTPGGPTGATVSVNSSNLTIDTVAHPPGQLTNSSSANGSDPAAAYTFGRTPPGVTRVEVEFEGGDRVPADVADGWYLATAVGEPSYRFADITKILAYAPDQTYTRPVRHG